METARLIEPRCYFFIDDAHHKWQSAVFRTELLLRNVRYVQLLGSMDLLVNDPSALGPNAHFGGTQIYDRTWRPKTHVWIKKARHNPFNRAWVANGDSGMNYYSEYYLLQKNAEPQRWDGLSTLFIVLAPHHPFQGQSLEALRQEPLPESRFPPH